MIGFTLKIHEKSLFENETNIFPQIDKTYQTLKKEFVFLKVSRHLKQH